MLNVGRAAGLPVPARRSTHAIHEPTNATPYAINARLPISGLQASNPVIFENDQYPSGLQHLPQLRFIVGVLI